MNINLNREYFDLTDSFPANNLHFQNSNVILYKINKHFLYYGKIYFYSHFIFPQFARQITLYE